MSLVSKKRIRKIRTSIENTEISQDAKQQLYIHKPESRVEVFNPGLLDKATEKALQTEEAILFHTKSIFPLDIIPNELIIKEKSVSIKWNHILNANTQTMLVKDIGYVTINDNKLLAALVISYKSPLENIEIINLRPQDAYEAKAIIEKLMIQISENGIDKSPAADISYV